MYFPVPSPADVHMSESQGSRKINFKDFAHLVASGNWLDDALEWP
jgi:hypothetical protein